MIESSSGSVHSKVAAATLGFWVAKILATTLGETGGDALSMTFDLGYAVSTAIFLTCFVVALALQVRATRYHPTLYWLVVVTTTTVGTTTSDMLDRTFGLGYVASSAGELALVVALLLLWRATTGHVAVDHVTSKVDEVFYWVTILASNTLGTALGDFTADDLGLGFEKGALVFAALLAVVAVLYLATKLPRPVLFWAAYVLTRPLGATLGDTLTKPVADGGLNLGRVGASLAIAGALVLVVAITDRWQRPPSSTPR